MALPHNWDECRPAVLGEAGSKYSPEHHAAFQKAMDDLWPTLTPLRRVMFHEFTCLNMTDTEHQTNVAQIIGMAQAAMK